MQKDVVPDHTQWHTHTHTHTHTNTYIHTHTLSRTPLYWWSARCKDLYLTTHNTHNRQIYTPPVGFEPTISASDRRKTYSLNSAANGIELITLIITTRDNAKYYFDNRKLVKIYSFINSQTFLFFPQIFQAETPLNTSSNAQHFNVCLLSELTPRGLQSNANFVFLFCFLWTESSTQPLLCPPYKLKVKDKT